jgi:hypothetical protein
VAEKAASAPILGGSQQWLDPAWRSQIVSWAETELAALGRQITGPVEQPHVRPWSTALRIPTDGGTAWLKAIGLGHAYEGPLLLAFRDLGVGRVVLPLAVEPARGWILFDDAGPTLRATQPDGHGDHDPAAWERILPEYAELQRSVERPAAIATMLAAGTPDGRPDRLPADLARLLDDDRIWQRVLPDERADAGRVRAALTARLPEIAGLASRVAASGVQPSVQHDDLHGGNIVVGPDGDRFFDWGDAVVAHPFATLTTTFNSIAHHTERSLDDPLFERLRDVYTEAWTDVAPRNELAEVARLAIVLGCVGKALAWERALFGLDEAEMDGHGDAVAAWLMEFEGRLDR